MLTIEEKTGSVKKKRQKAKVNSRSYCKKVFINLKTDHKRCGLGGDLSTEGRDWTASKNSNFFIFYRISNFILF